VRVEAEGLGLTVRKEAPEVGHSAKALDASIFTETDDPAKLEIIILRAAMCHFEELERPRIR
jgi:hypothetical protein